VDQGWYTIRQDGLEITIRLTPKSSRDAVESVETGADGKRYLKARVRAVPEKGKANKALIALLAKETGLKKSAISITSGDTSRMKTLLLECEADEQTEAVAGLFRASR
jgi:uncharacterized protein (TIGR00251 family)